MGSVRQNSSTDYCKGCAAGGVSKPSFGEDFTTEDTISFLQKGQKMAATLLLSIMVSWFSVISNRVSPG